MDFEVERAAFVIVSTGIGRQASGENAHYFYLWWNDGCISLPKP